MKMAICGHQSLTTDFIAILGYWPWRGWKARIYTFRGEARQSQASRAIVSSTVKDLGQCSCNTISSPRHLFPIDERYRKEPGLRHIDINANDGNLGILDTSNFTPKLFHHISLPAA